MIYDIQALSIKYKDYKNINLKVCYEVKKGKLIRIKKGLFSSNIEIDAPLLANVCYSPSYISFEYALSYYGLIPEYVSNITSATYKKKNNKIYDINKLCLIYNCIPEKAFYYGIVFKNNEEGIKFKIACKEKALCDVLYIKYPVRSIKDLKTLLFDDLRIDEEQFYKLDFNLIKQYGPLYHSNSINVLIKMINDKGANNGGVNN